MASLVNTLKKAVSVQESEALCPKPASSLPASPSFSDFSLCAHTDGEYPDQELHVGLATGGPDLHTASVLVCA